jgi:hypothetical protein
MTHTLPHRILTLGILSVLGLFTAPPAYAANVEVLGNVYQCETPIAFVPVSATCGTQTLNTLTGSTGGDNGKYSLTFNNASCVYGSTVNVQATVGGTPFNGSGTVGSFFFFNNKANVDFQTDANCATPAVPEFGLVTGLMTLAASAGAFKFLRRKSA